MRVYRAEDYKAMSRRAASIIAAQVMQKPNCVLGLATGSTPVGAYEQLVEWYKQGDLSFKEVSSVNLDEYLGLTGDHPQSYRYFMQKNLFDHVDIDVAKTNVPSGMAEDAEAESKRYEKVMADLGGIDLQLLGMGHNGHIGFNEPAEKFTTHSFCVKLTEQTLKDNRRFFEDDAVMPTHALTMGIASIMQAKRIVLVATGKNKAVAVKAMIEGPVDPKVPASILQMHRHATIILDEEAAALLKK